MIVPPTDGDIIRDETLARADVERLIAAERRFRLLECTLEDVDLSRLSLADWTFERTILKRAKLTGARLERTRWLSCRGAEADFSSSCLSEATFQASDFNNASFRRAKVDSTSFKGCKLTGADFSEAGGLGLVFEEALLIAAKLPSISFRKMFLSRLDFSQADLRKCDFREAVFEHCSLRDSHLVDARFEGADLRGADIGGMRLQDARRFKGATISKSQASQLLAELGLDVR
jgi:fluoroquinolone resistance protein